MAGSRRALGDDSSSSSIRSISGSSRGNRLVVGNTGTTGSRWSGRVRAAEWEAEVRGYVPNAICEYYLFPVVVAGAGAGAGGNVIARVVG